MILYCSLLIYLAVSVSVYSFGSNEYGSLAAPASVSSSITPYKISFFSFFSISSFSVGDDTSLVSTSCPSIYVFGDNFDNRLGLPDLYEFVFTPTQLSSLFSTSQSVSTFFSTIYLTTSGHVYSVGTTSSSTLGYPIDFPSPKSMPLTQIPALSNIKAISAGRSFVFALDLYGNLFSWGSGNSGKLAQGSSSGCGLLVLTSPNKVVTSILFKKINCGRDSCVGISSDNLLFFWGEHVSTSRPLGSIFGLTTCFPTPTPVPSPCPSLYFIHEVSLATSHSLVLCSNGEVYCIGLQNARQCGLGHANLVENFTKIIGGDLSTSLTISSIKASTFASFLISSEGILFSFGHSSYIGRVSSPSSRFDIPLIVHLPEPSYLIDSLWTHSLVVTRPVISSVISNTIPAPIFGQNISVRLDNELNLESRFSDISVSLSFLNENNHELFKFEEVDFCYNQVFNSELSTKLIVQIQCNYNVNLFKRLFLTVTIASIPSLPQEIFFDFSCPNYPCHPGSSCAGDTCLCDFPYTGLLCLDHLCPNGCSNNGYCEPFENIGFCVCNDLFAGNDCSIKLCPFDCYNQGTCVTGFCHCFEGFDGEVCQRSLFPNITDVIYNDDCSTLSCHVQIYGQNFGDVASSIDFLDYSVFLRDITYFYDVELFCPNEDISICYYSNITVVKSINFIHTFNHYFILLNEDNCPIFDTNFENLDSFFQSITLLNRTFVPSDSCVFIPNDLIHSFNLNYFNWSGCQYLQFSVNSLLSNEFEICSHLPTIFGFNSTKISPFGQSVLIDGSNFGPFVSVLLEGNVINHERVFVDYFDCFETTVTEYSSEILRMYCYFPLNSPISNCSESISITKTLNSPYELIVNCFNCQENYCSFINESFTLKSNISCSSSWYLDSAVVIIKNYSSTIYCLETNNILVPIKSFIHYELFTGNLVVSGWSTELEFDGKPAVNVTTVSATIGTVSNWNYSVFNCFDYGLVPNISLSIVAVENCTFTGIFWSHSLLKVDIPSGYGNSFIQIIVGNQISNPFYFNYSSFVLESIEPLYCVENEVCILEIIGNVFPINTILFDLNQNISFDYYFLSSSIALFNLSYPFSPGLVNFSLCFHSICDVSFQFLITKSCNFSCLNGYCFDGECLCNYGYEGIHCQLISCPNDCFSELNHGYCNNGTCICSELFYGSSCEHSVCMNDCTGRGSCIGHCLCDSPWTGIDCSIISDGFTVFLNPDSNIIPTSGAEISLFLYGNFTLPLEIFSNYSIISVVTDVLDHFYYTLVWTYCNEYDFEYFYENINVTCIDEFSCISSHFYTLIPLSISDVTPCNNSHFQTSCTIIAEFPSRTAFCLKYSNISHDFLVSAINVSVPEGKGGDFPLIFNTEVSSYSLILSYDMPIITSVSPSSCATFGCKISLFGRNFGVSSSDVSILFGFIPCPVDLAFPKTHTLVTCDLQPGVGQNLPVFISVEGQSSEATHLFSFFTPVIESVIPSKVHWSGSHQVLLSGQNFGTNISSVLLSINNVSTSVKSITDDSIIFDSIAGCGAFEIVLRVGNVFLDKFSLFYQVPNIIIDDSFSFAITPNSSLYFILENADVSFVTTVCHMEVFIDELMCSNLVFENLNQNLLVSCTPPIHFGQNLPAFLSLNGVFTLLNTSINYEPPIISSISPTFSAVETSEIFTITGTNLGFCYMDPLICFGSDIRCCLKPFYCNNSVLKSCIPHCTGSNLEVSLTLGGFTTFSSTLFSYESPIVFDVFPTEFSADYSGVVELFGNNFGFFEGSILVSDTVFLPLTQNNSYTSFNFNLASDLPCLNSSNISLQFCASSQCSNVFKLFVLPPILYNVHPQYLSTDGQDLITLTGVDLLAPRDILPTVAFYSIVESTFVFLDVLDHNNTFMSVQSIPGVGYNLDLFVSICSRVSNVLTISYYGPEITFVAPNAIPVYGGVTVSIFGRNFGKFDAFSTLFMNLNIQVDFDIITDNLINFDCPAYPEPLSVPLTLEVAGQTSNSNFSLEFYALSVRVSGVNAGFGSSFSPVSNLAYQRVISISGGTTHGLIATDFALYVFGRSSEHALGMNSVLDVTGFVVNHFINPTMSSMISQVSTNNHVSLVLLSNGTVLGFGSATESRLCFSDIISLRTPTILPLPPVSSISAGVAHTLFLSLSGDVVSCGNSVATVSPNFITAINNCTGISAGKGHSFVISNGFGFGFASGTSCRLGIGTTQCSLVPVQIHLNFQLQMISSKDSHALALTTAGEVYSFGDNHAGELGLGHQSQVLTPTRINFGETRIAHVATHFRHSFCISVSGELFSFGRNNDGVLGLGYSSSTPVRTPQKVAGLPSTLLVDSGGTFSIITTGWRAPVVYSFSSLIIPTHSPPEIFISGDNFGEFPNDFLLCSTLGPCFTTVFWHSSSSISFVPFESVGIHSLILSVSLYSIPLSQTLSFLPPSITQVLPSTVRTVDATLEIFGDNFGPFIDQISASVCSSPCFVTSLSEHSLIICSLTQGVGSSQFTNITVVVGGQSFILPSPFSFTPPTITHVSPSHLSSFKPTNMRIFGSGFGTTSAACYKDSVVYIGSFVCYNLIHINDSSLECTVPSGFGTNLSVTVCVNDQCVTENDVVHFLGLEGWGLISTNSEGSYQILSLLLDFDVSLIDVTVFESTFYGLLNNSSVVSCTVFGTDCFVLTNDIVFMSSNGHLINFSGSIFSVSDPSTVLFVVDNAVLITDCSPNSSFVVLSNQSICQLLSTELFCYSPRLNLRVISESLSCFEDVLYGLSFNESLVSFIFNDDMTFETVVLVSTRVNSFLVVNSTIFFVSDLSLFVMETETLVVVPLVVLDLLEVFAIVPFDSLSFILTGLFSDGINTAVFSYSSQSKLQAFSPLFNLFELSFYSTFFNTVFVSTNTVDSSNHFFFNLSEVSSFDGVVVLPFTGVPRISFIHLSTCLSSGFLSFSYQTASSLFFDVPPGYSPALITITFFNGTTTKYELSLYPDPKIFDYYPQDFPSSGGILSILGEHFGVLGPHIVTSFLNHSLDVLTFDDSIISLVIPPTTGLNLSFTLHICSYVFDLQISFFPPLINSIYPKYLLEYNINTTVFVYGFSFGLDPFIELIADVDLEFVVLFTNHSVIILEFPFIPFLDFRPLLNVSIVISTLSGATTVDLPLLLSPPECTPLCINGECVVGDYCECNFPFVGSDCSLIDPAVLCPTNCSGHGLCVSPLGCECFEDFTGTDCSDYTPYLSCLDNCVEGTCSASGECVCIPGFVGHYCSITAFDCDDCVTENTDSCSEIDGCQCKDLWGGTHCEISLSKCTWCPPNSFCNESTGVCVCNSGWSGPLCDTLLCLNDCNGNGFCNNGTCECFTNYYESDCSVLLLPCPNDCSGNGICNNGTCICSSLFKGFDCSVKLCPGNCNQNGYCLDGVCHCFFGFSGVSCTTRSCSFKCLNSGSCSAGHCNCPSGFSGLDCSIHSNFCSLGTYSSSLRRCICPEFASGSFCESVGSVELDSPSFFNDVIGFNLLSRRSFEFVLTPITAAVNLSLVFSSNSDLSNPSQSVSSRSDPLVFLASYSDFPTIDHFDFMLSCYVFLDKKFSCKFYFGRNLLSKPLYVSIVSLSDFTFFLSNISVSSSCPFDCNGKGICQELECICSTDYFGQFCEHYCRGSCSHRGTCSGLNKCDCGLLYFGATCQFSVILVLLISLLFVFLILCLFKLRQRVVCNRVT
ncbi:hypothetical protein RCL1_005262 [Eukaryota sp. TZLM3-RCL]